MKTRPFFLLVPALLLAAGYFAWETDRPAAPEPTSKAVTAVAPAPLIPDAERPAPPLQAAVDPAYEDLRLPGPHPYEGYPSGALELLSYSDARAAEILGLRYRDYDEVKAMSLALRASALSGGDPAPVLLYFNAYRHPSSIDGVPVRKTVHTKFVLAAVADLLNTDTHYAEPWENTIRKYSSDPGAEIVMLHRIANRLVDDMRQIELDVTGSSSFGGPGDA